MEDHHFVKRKNFLLRYSFRNSFLVGKYQESWQKMSCHAFCETPAGRKKINDYLIENGWFDYIQERVGSCKQWFTEHGISRNDYKRQMYDELKEILNDER
jgi:hypothetical protein